MRAFIQLATLLAIGMVPALHAAGASAQPVECAALGRVALADTTIHAAEPVPAGGFTPPGEQMPGPPADYSALPAFCRVTGSIAPSPDSDIRFEVWLPAENWNGKFLQTGNGGAAGAIMYASLAEPLVRGYAVANTDTGHQGGMGDFTWVPGHPEKLTDYQHRAVHELTRVGKDITAAHYGKAPEKSYWYGCSTGGRQGLKEALKYPADYDAILAGAPANNLLALVALTAMIPSEMNASGLDAEKLSLLKESAIAKCDTADGIADRVISDPQTCAFDPAALVCTPGQTENCLSVAQADAAKRIYAGVVDEAGNELFPGTGPGSEVEWAAYATPAFSIGTSYYQNVVYGDPAWQFTRANAAADIARAEELDAGGAKAMDPDLSAFFAHGGKLILYHGMSDGFIPWRNTVNYYESVVDRLGAEAVDENARLYLVPGMDHCAGGEGPFNIDWLTALDEWSEEGKAPGALLGSHPAEIPGAFGAPAQPSKPYTRPVCPYPQIAKYKGDGLPSDAANFQCSGP